MIEILVSSLIVGLLPIVYLCYVKSLRQYCPLCEKSINNLNYHFNRHLDDYTMTQNNIDLMKIENWTRKLSSYNCLPNECKHIFVQLCGESVNWNEYHNGYMSNLIDIYNSYNKEKYRNGYMSNLIDIYDSYDKEKYACNL